MFPSSGTRASSPWRSLSPAWPYSSLTLVRLRSQSLLATRATPPNASCRIASYVRVLSAVLQPRLTMPRSRSAPPRLPLVG